MNTNKALTATALFIVLAIIHFDSTTVAQGNFIVEENGSLQTYFCPEHNCTHEFKKIISSTGRVKCAFYAMNEPSIARSITESNASMVIHSENYNGIGMPVRRNGLMHHKFCTDGKGKVITGSYNPTESEKENLNNIIIIESKTIAGNYKEEFLAIKNGKEKTRMKTSKVNLSGTIVKNYFCPQDPCQEKILMEIERAEETIHFMTFTFTDMDVARAIASKHEEGIKVKGVIESFQRKDLWVKPYLKEKGIDVKEIRGRSFQHNKVFVIDKTTTITGSYNPTRAAHTINDENILIIKDEKTSKEYAEYIERLHSIT